MNVLIACEESQAVCIEMRRLGHRAFSCDIQDCSGGHPEWHIKGDALEIINPRTYFKKRDGTLYGVAEENGILFETASGDIHFIENQWDLIIAHPPCTYLTLAGNKWFKSEYKDRFPERAKQREAAVEFFMQFANADCDRIAIENPVGIMSSRWRKPDQYIEPYFFGEPEKKKTGLWLKGLPTLKPTNIVDPIIVHCASGANEPRWHMETMKLPKEERSRARSKTFPGIARAMAEQWAGSAQHDKEDRDG